MKALVTGGAGLIGSHIVDMLLARGDRVVALDSLHPETHKTSSWGNIPEWVNGDAELVFGDVADRSAVRAAMEGVDMVFHQAAYGGFAPKPVETTTANALGTAVVMEEARRAGVRKVVLASSQAVYGHGSYRCFRCQREPNGERTQEQMLQGHWEVVCPVCDTTCLPLRLSVSGAVSPRTPYALSKWYAEQLALSLGRTWQLPVVALRYALVYGPRQSVHNPYTGICSIFATRLRNGLPPLIYEDGQQTRDFTFVTDAAAANLLVADTDAADGRVFNVATGVATTVHDFAVQLAAALGMNVSPVVTGEFRPGDARHLVADATPLVRLGWKPTVGLQAGLESYCEWMLEQPTPEDGLPAAREVMRAHGVLV